MTNKGKSVTKRLEDSYKANAKLREYLETSQQDKAELQYDYDMLMINFEALALHGVKDLVKSATEIHNYYKDKEKT